MHLSHSRIASLLFAASALGPIGVWAILLTPLEQASSLLAYMFAAQEISELERAFHVLMVALPVLLVGLSVESWYRTAKNGIGRVWRVGLGLAATGAAVLVFWPAAITSLMATCLGGKRVEV